MSQGVNEIVGAEASGGASKQRLRHWSQAWTILTISILILSICMRDILRRYCNT